MMKPETMRALFGGAEPGTCTRCHRNPPKPGRKRCEACSQRCARWQSENMARRRAAGICVVPGCEFRPNPGRVYCPGHARANLDYVRRRTAILAQAGICYGCREKMAAVDSVAYCPSCRERKNTYLRAWRERSKAG